MREFYQCDIDVIGTESLIAEAEVACVITTVFTELGFKNFQIKTNSRHLMNDILRAFAVPKDKAMDVIRVIGKLAKIGEAAGIEEIGSNFHIIGQKAAVELGFTWEQTAKISQFSVWSG